MSKKAANKAVSYYAVHKGRNPGVYSTWAEVESQVNGYSNSIHKKFGSASEAQAFVLNGGGSTSNTSSSHSSTRTAPRSKTQSSTSSYQTQNYTSSNQPSSSSSTLDYLQQNSNTSSNNQTRAIQKFKPRYKVYCDGACSGNGKKGVETPAGSGVWWEEQNGLKNPPNLAKRLPGPNQSNNRAELYAIWLALESDPDPSSTIEILTDSQYSINCLGSWSQKWVNNNYKTSNGNPVENQDLIKSIKSKIEDRNLINPNGLIFTYVKGHSGDLGNNQADALARLGATMDPVENLYL